MVVLLLHVGALGMVRVLLSRRCLALLSLWHRYLCWRVVGGVVMAVLVLLSISYGGGVVVCRCCWHGDGRRCCWHGWCLFPWCCNFESDAADTV
jgi:hypothetical protein